MFEIGARPHPPQELYRAYLAQSDIFIGLYWQRYGWIGPGMEISGLEDELQLSGSLPRLMYVKTPAPDREPQLANMLAGLEAAGTDSYRSFRTPRELGRLVRNDLALLLSERFSTTGRVAESQPAPSHVVAATVADVAADIDIVDRTRSRDRRSVGPLGVAGCSADHAHRPRRHRQDTAGDSCRSAARRTILAPGGLRAARFDSRAGPGAATCCRGGRGNHRRYPLAGGCACRALRGQPLTARARQPRTSRRGRAGVGCASVDVSRI